MCVHTKRTSKCWLASWIDCIVQLSGTWNLITFLNVRQRHSYGDLTVVAFASIPIKRRYYAIVNYSLNSDEIQMTFFKWNNLKWKCTVSSEYCSFRSTELSSNDAIRIVCGFSEMFAIDVESWLLAKCTPHTWRELKIRIQCGLWHCRSHNMTNVIN